MTDDELKQLVASNARAIQAAANERSELRQTEFQTTLDGADERAQLRQAILKLTDIQQGISNLLSRLDKDWPTILRKLNTIENKVDWLLERQDNDRSPEFPQ